MGLSAVIDSIRASSVVQTTDSTELYRTAVFVPSGSDEPPVRLSVLDVPPHQPGGETLVLLHGYAANSSWWRPQIPALAQENRVIAIDARGSGLSAQPETGYTIEQLADDVATVLDALGVAEPVVVAGHSTGGFVVTDFTLRYPERVKKIILVATPLSFAGSSTIRTANFFMSFPDFFFRIGQRVYELDPRGQASLLGLKRLFRDSLIHWDGTEKFSRIQQPALVIEGFRDALFPASSYQKEADLLPQAEIVQIRVSKHQVTLERPKAVLRAVQQFIAPESAFKPAWRSENDDVESIRLLTKRPWIVRYEGDLPAELLLPRVTLTHLLAHAVRHFGKRPGLQFGKSYLTYEQVGDEALRLARSLTEWGVTEGDRVFFVLPNVPQLVIALYAVTHIGGIAVLADPADSAERLAAQANQTGAAYLIIPAALADAAQSLMEQTAVDRVLFTSEADYGAAGKRPSAKPFSLPAGSVRWQAMLDGVSAEPFLPTATAETTAVLLFTGANVVALSHANLIAAAVQLGSWLTPLPQGTGSVLSGVSFSTAYGLTLGVNTAVFRAAKMILPEDTAVDTLLETIKKESPTLFLGTPSLYKSFVWHQALKSFMPQEPPLFLSSGAPLPVEVEEAFQRLTRARVLELYGLTETGYAAMATPVKRDRTGSVGLPVPNTAVRVTHPDTGETLPFDHPGLLWLRGPQLAPGYWQDGAITPLAADGWLNTGDLAEMDDDGYFRILGRVGEVLVVADTAVFPRDIEETIYEMPGVMETAVFVKDGQFVACVVKQAPDQPPTTEDILAFCRKRLPHAPAILNVNLPKRFNLS